MNENRILTDRFIDPDCSPCSCFGKMIEQVHLAASLATVGWQCSACGHRWPTDWARVQARIDRADEALWRCYANTGKE